MGSIVKKYNMTLQEIIILNFEEIRRRSVKLWSGIPESFYNWKPDEKAMSCMEMIRHVLEGEHLFHIIVNNKGNIGDYISPWKNLPFTNLQEELNFALPFRESFLKTILTFSTEDLSNIEIVRTEKNQRRKLGDYLQRIAYHEAVHTGQMLSYCRAMGIDIPLIWD
jgi:uncharacterized damage-inducible protein DinB